MKTINVIIAECKKIIFSPYFLIGMIVFTIMCFTSELYYDGKIWYSVWSTMGLIGEDNKNIPDFSAEYVCQFALGRWVIMFQSIIVAFPFVKILCDERTTKEKRYIISRTGVFRYAIAKFISAVLSAIILCAVGFILFSSVVYMVFPSSSEISDVFFMGVPYWKSLLSVAITGGASVILAYFMCSFVRNQYLCICIPFLAHYLQMVILSKLMISNLINTSNGVIDNKSRIAEIILSSLSATNLAATFYGTENDNYSIYAFGSLSVISIVFFYLMQRRKTDVGE